MKSSKCIKLCFLFLAVFIAFTLICTFVLRMPIHVSMAEILENPDKFHGKYITTEGVWQYELEDHNLYFNQEGRTDMINMRAIWLEIPNEIHSLYYEQLAEMSGRYVSISGKFNAKNKGHYDRSAGEIAEISKCEIIG